MILNPGLGLGSWALHSMEHQFITITLIWWNVTLNSSWRWSPYEPCQKIKFYQVGCREKCAARDMQNPNLWAFFWELASTEGFFLKHSIWIMPHICMTLNTFKTLPSTWFHVMLTIRKVVDQAPVSWQDSWGLLGLLKGLTNFWLAANKRLVKDGTETKIRFLSPSPVLFY